MRRLFLVLLLWPLGVGADFRVGAAAFQRDDYATAYREWRPLAEAGNADAQTFLGVLYAYGKGVPEDDRDAVKLGRLNNKNKCRTRVVGIFPSRDTTQGGSSSRSGQVQIAFLKGT